MYVATPHESLVALDPETGKVIWTFKHSNHTGRPARGIAYWEATTKTTPRASSSAPVTVSLSRSISKTRQGRPRLR